MQHLYSVLNQGDVLNVLFISSVNLVFLFTLYFTRSVYATSKTVNKI